MSRTIVYDMVHQTPRISDNSANLLLLFRRQCTSTSHGMTYDLPHTSPEHHKRRNLEKSQNIPPNLPILPHKITQLGLGIIAVPLLDEERSKIRLHRPSQLWPSTLEEDKTFMKYICISVGTLSVSQYTSCSSPRYSAS